MKKWVVEKMAWIDPETGEYPWGVSNTLDAGYGYDTFDTEEEARDYAREMNSEEAE